MPAYEPMEDMPYGGTEDEVPEEGDDYEVVEDDGMGDYGTGEEMDYVADSY